MNPDARLCKDNQLLPPTISEAFQNIGDGEDLLSTGRIDWESPHFDTLAAKGVVSLEDQYGVNDGKDPVLAVLEKMHESGQRGNPDLDADVAVSYDFQAKKHLRALADFRRTQ